MSSEIPFADRLRDQADKAADTMLLVRVGKRADGYVLLGRDKAYEIATVLEAARDLTVRPWSKQDWVALHAALDAVDAVKAQ